MLLYVLGFLCTGHADYHLKPVGKNKNTGTEGGRSVKEERLSCGVAAEAFNMKKCFLGNKQQELLGFRHTVLSPRSAEDAFLKLQ